MIRWLKALWAWFVGYKNTDAALPVLPMTQTVVQLAQQLKPVSDLTPDLVISAAKALLPDRIGGAVWVDVRTGGVDKGITVDLFHKDRISGFGLLGHKTFGAALGYRFAQQGNLMASVFAGAAHPYEGALKSGWDPVAGITIKF